MGSESGLSRARHIGIRSERRIMRIMESRMGRVRWLERVRESTPTEDLDGIDVVAEVEEVGELYIQVKSSYRYEAEFLRGYHTGQRGVLPIVTIVADPTMRDEEIWERMIERLNRVRKLFLVYGDRRAERWLHDTQTINNAADEADCEQDEEAVRRLLQVLRDCNWCPPFLEDVGLMHPPDWNQLLDEGFGLLKTPLLYLVVGEDANVLVRTVRYAEGRVRLTGVIARTLFEPSIMVVQVPEVITGEWLASFFCDLSYKRIRLLRWVEETQKKARARLN